MRRKNKILNSLENLSLEFADKNLLFRISKLDIGSYRRKKIRTELKKIEEYIGQTLPEDIHNLYKQYNGFGFSWIDGTLELIPLSSILEELNNKKAVWKKAKIETFPLFMSRTLNLHFEVRFKLINGIVRLFIGHIDPKNKNVLLQPLTWDCFDLMLKAIENKGCLLYMFFDFVYPKLNQAYKQALSIELQKILKGEHKPSNKWQSYIDSFKEIENLNVYADGSNSVLKSQYKLVFAHVLGFAPHQSLLTFFAETDGGIKLSYSTQKGAANSFSIWHWSKFLTSKALVYQYLGLEAPNIDIAFHQYRVLVYKEFPIFIKLAVDCIEMYRYDYSTKNLNKIELSFDVFMAKLFECYKVENWEVLFIESFKKHPYRNDILKAITERHSEIPLDQFLDSEYATKL